MDIRREEIKAKQSEEAKKEATFKIIKTTTTTQRTPQTATTTRLEPLEEAREKIKESLVVTTVRNPFSSTARNPFSSTSVRNPFSTTLREDREDLTTTESPMATMRNLIRERLAEAATSTTTTTTTTTARRTTTTAAAPTTETAKARRPKTSLDRMMAARERLRALMGRPPKTTTTTKAPPTTEDPMAEARLRVLEKLRKPRPSNPLQDPGDFDNVLDLPREKKQDPLISVTSKARHGEVVSPGTFVPPDEHQDPLLRVSSSPTRIPAPSITFEPLDDLPSTTFRPPATTISTDFNDFTTTVASSSLPTVAPTRQELLELLESQTPMTDVSDRMQGTLLRLMKKGRKEDGARATEGPILVDSEEEFRSLVSGGDQNLLQRLILQGTNGDAATSPPAPVPVPVTTTTMVTPVPEQTTVRFGTTGGFRKDPLVTRKLTEGHNGFVKPRRTFSDFKPPKRNPLLRKLRGRHRGRYRGLRLPPRKQDLLLRTLQGGRDDTIEGLAPPDPEEEADAEVIGGGGPPLSGDRLLPLNDRSNPLLTRTLQGGRTGAEHSIRTPPVRQNTLLRPLTPKRTGSGHDLKVPSVRQNTLLRPLTSGQTASHHDLEVPSAKQDTLLRPLTGGSSASDHDLEVPTLKQNTLLRPLTSGHTASDHELEVPSLKQNTLLRPLTSGQTGADHALDMPSLKQDTLLRPLRPGQSAADHDLPVPSQKQNTLFRPLTGSQTASDHDLEVPSRKQNTLLRPLTPGQTGSDHLLDLPEEIPPVEEVETFVKALSGDSAAPDRRRPVPLVNRDPLARPLEPKAPFNPNALSLPAMRLNPLLKILR